MHGHMQYRLNRKLLDSSQWRNEVYDFQRAGKMDRRFRATASAFGKGSAVRLANPDVPEERVLIDDVLDGCVFHKIRQIPPVAIVDTRIVNAASVGGRGIFFTTGIMKKMPPEQIRAIVGHELGHHRHVLRDQPILLALELAVVAAIEVMDKSTLSLWSKLLKPQSGRFAHMGALAAAIATDLMVVSTVFTPWRWFMELDSDKDGAQFGGSRHMADALETLKNQRSELKEKRELTLPQKIAKAMLKVRGFIVNPWGSHPPMDWRIKRVREGKHYIGMPVNHDVPPPMPPMRGLPHPTIRADEAQHAATLNVPQAQVGA